MQANCHSLRYADGGWVTGCEAVAAGCCASVTEMLFAFRFESLVTEPPFFSTELKYAAIGDFVEATEAFSVQMMTKHFGMTRRGSNYTFYPGKQRCVVQAVTGNLIRLDGQEFGFVKSCSYFELVEARNASVLIGRKRYAF